MSFSFKFKTLWIGNSYDLRSQPEMSTHGEEKTREAKTRMVECSEENNIRFSPELVDEKIKPSLDPLHAQISVLIEMMDRLIHTAKECTTVSSRGSGHQYQSPYRGEPASFRFPKVAPLNTAGYSPDTQQNKNAKNAVWLKNTKVPTHCLKESMAG